MDKIKLMIVDDHPIVRDGLKQLCEIDQAITVVAEAKGGLECLDLLERVSPDIILMDVRMPGISGIETARVIRDKYPRIKVVMLTMYQDEEYVAEAIQAGAKGYVLKNVRREELSRIVHQAMANEEYVDPTLAVHVGGGFKRLQPPGGHAKPPFTKRELEILKEIVAGNTDRAIAKTLCISEFTVRSHIRHIFQKLGTPSRAKTVAKAIQNKLITIE
jgi:DNA-binding NarL/FixJ family response regulator